MSRCWAGLNVAKTAGGYLMSACLFKPTQPNHEKALWQPHVCDACAGADRYRGLARAEPQRGSFSRVGAESNDAASAEKRSACRSYGALSAVVREAFARGRGRQLAAGKVLRGQTSRKRRGSDCIEGGRWRAGYQRPG